MIGRSESVASHSTSPAASDSSARSSMLGPRPSADTAISGTPRSPLPGGTTTGTYPEMGTCKSRVASACEELLERFRLCDRPLAGEVLTHVRGRSAVDQVAPLEQRHAIRRTSREHEVGTKTRTH